ncbi:class I SAM-dependent methyltransferase [Nocardia sp. bgisy118]|uniref:class I SAM-dependent methyltransferase n=1 Tax=Nocardia sp. bgisy118 TaxID=3413786 RepID=UPI003F4A6A05
MGDARFRWFADVMELRGTDRVLEIGPGSSPSLALLAERVTHGRVVGVDRSATAIARAAQRLGAGRGASTDHAEPSADNPAEAGGRAPTDHAPPSVDEACAPAAQVNSDRIGLFHADLARLRPEQLLDTFGIDGFDKILAVNVNVFWTKRPTAELAVIEKLLVSGGGLYLCYGYGGPDGASTSPKPPPGRLDEYLTEAGFTVRTRASGDLLCVHAARD